MANERDPCPDVAKVSPQKAKAILEDIEQDPYGDAERTDVEDLLRFAGFECEQRNGIRIYTAPDGVGRVTIHTDSGQIPTTVAKFIARQVRETWAEGE